MTDVAASPRSSQAPLHQPADPPRSGLRAAAIVALALWALTVILIAVSLITARSGGPDDPQAALEQGAAALMLGTVGAVLMTRLPRNLIGWLLALGGLQIALASAASGAADYGLDLHLGSVPGAVWLAWLSQVIWAPELALLFIVLPLLYPTGRLPSPRWRVVLLVAVGLVIVGGGASALSPWSPDPFAAPNPLALGGPSADVVAILENDVATALLLVGGVLAIASLVLRYRRAATIERQQLRWFALVAMISAFGGTVSVAATVAAGPAGPTGALAVVDSAAGLVIYAGLALLPVAIGIAVLRYRLYEIDRLISRTIAYGVLTLLLGSLFVAAILALQALIEPSTGSNDLAVAGSTLLVAALALPLRDRIQRVVDRRFNRSHYDAEQTVAALAARLATKVDLDAVQADLLATVEAALEPTVATAWLRT